MEQENDTGKKILIGCCSAVAVFAVLAVMAGVVFGKKGWQMIKKASAEQAAFAVIEESWVTSHSDETDGAMLLPGEVGDFQLKSQDRSTDIPQLKISGVEGWRGVYEGPNGQKMEIIVYPVTDAEAQSIKAGAEEGISDSGNRRFTVGWLNQFRYSVSPPERSGVLWHAPGSNWLISQRFEEKRDDLGDLFQEYFETLNATAP